MTWTDDYTIIGRFADTGDVTVAFVPRHAGNGDPHMAALEHTGALSERGEFEVVAVFRGKCDVLVTQQSLRLFAYRLLSTKA